MTVTTATMTLLAAAATEAAGRSSLTLAVIAGAFVVVGSIAGPLITEWLRDRRRRPPTDHHAEVVDEQAQLVQHLLGEITERDDEIEQLKKGRHEDE